MIMKKVRFLSIGLLMTILLVTWSCEEETSDDVCSAFQAPSCSTLTFTTCEDESGNIYYQYDGKDYFCKDYDLSTDTVECQSTIDKIVSLSNCVATTDFSDELSLKSARISYVSFLLNAKEEVHAKAIAAAGCN